MAFQPIAAIRKGIEDWGRTNPVTLTVFGLLVGLIPAGTIAGVSGYKKGFYDATKTSESYWHHVFSTRLKEGVNEQLAAKCGEAVSKVTMSFQHQVIRLEKTQGALEAQVKQQNNYIQSQQDEIRLLQLKQTINEYYDLMVKSVEGLLEQFREAEAKKDIKAQQLLKDRFYSLLLDVVRLHHTYVDGASLFNGRATAMAQRYKDGQSIPTDAIVSYLEYFSTDTDRKKKVLESALEDLRKIKIIESVKKK